MVGKAETGTPSGSDKMNGLRQIKGFGSVSVGGLGAKVRFKHLTTECAFSAGDM